MINTTLCWLWFLFIAHRLCRQVAIVSDLNDFFKQVLMASKFYYSGKVIDSIIILVIGGVSCGKNLLSCILDLGLSTLSKTGLTFMVKLLNGYRGMGGGL